jgi:hypothetical protein
MKEIYLAKTLNKYNFYYLMFYENLYLILIKVNKYKYILIIY